MSDDLERRLQTSLREVRDAYRPRQQAGRATQRARFVQGYRRRRWIVPATSVAVAGAAALVALAVFSALPRDAGRQDRRTQFASIPGLVAAIPVGQNPVDVGTARGTVWVANSGDGTLTRIDAATNDVVGVLEPGGTPTEVDLGLGSLWLTNPTAGEVLRYDPVTQEEIARYEVASPGADLAMSIGDHAWIVVRGEALVRIDAATGETTPFSEGAPVDVAATPEALWVLDGVRGLMRRDPATGRQLGEAIPVTRRGLGDVFAGPGVLWVANGGDDTMFRIDSTTAELLGTPQLGGNYIDMALTPKVLWVLTRGDDVLLEARDPGSGDQLADPLPLKGRPTEVSTGQGSVWVTEAMTDSILRIEPFAP